MSAKAVVTITVIVTGEQGAAARLGGEEVARRAFRQLAQLDGVVSLTTDVQDYVQVMSDRDQRAWLDAHDPEAPRDVTR